MGLITCFSIVSKHGGHISVKSALGSGSTFYVYLPAVRKRFPAPPENEPAQAMASMAKRRVLVMDDEVGMRKTVGRMLKRLGCEDCVFAADGAKAIALYAKAMKDGKPFDIVMLDLTVPGGMGGKEAIEKLCKMDPEVKAIASSGYSAELDASKYQEYGFRGALAKPYILDQLGKVLHDLI